MTLATIERTIVLQWTDRPPGIGALKHWLQAPGSLTAHLRGVCRHFEVRPLRQGPCTADPDEARELGLPPGTRVHAREVVLACDGRPMVWARSVVEARLAHGPWKALAGLGTRPLAELLFRRWEARRTAMRHVCLAALGSWCVNGYRLGARRAALRARRSTFTRRGARLVLTEVFAPALAGRGRPRPGRRRSAD